jgi:hypothetical protein
LPIEVIDSKFLVDKYQLQEVSLGEHFQKNGLLQQRATEFLFPTKVNTTNKIYKIELISFEVKDCQIIQHYKTVTLYACE